MKFLVLALCVYAASAAVPAYRANQPWKYASQAVAQVSVPATQSEPIVQAAITPVVLAKTVYDNSEVNAPILRSESEVNAQGYQYSYETGNGISASSSGILKKVEDAEVVVSKGGYRYIAPDGTPVEVTYIADENGYQPQSNLLPVGPATPEAILRSLKYIAEHPQPIEPLKKF